MTTGIGAIGSNKGQTTPTVKVLYAALGEGGGTSSAVFRLEDVELFSFDLVE